MSNTRPSSVVAANTKPKRPDSHRHILGNQKPRVATRFSHDEMAIINAFNSPNPEDVSSSAAGIRELAAEINYFPELIGTLYKVFQKIPDSSSSSVSLTQAEQVRFELIAELFKLALDPEYEDLLQACCDALENIFKLIDLHGLIKLEGFLRTKEISAEVQVYLFIIQSWKKPTSVFVSQLKELPKPIKILHPLARSCWNIAKASFPNELRREQFKAGVADLMLKDGVEHCLDGFVKKLFLRAMFADMPTLQQEAVVEYISNTGDEISGYPEGSEELLWSLRCDWFDGLTDESNKVVFAAVILSHFTEIEVANPAHIASMLQRLWSYLGEYTGFQEGVFEHYFALAMLPDAGEKCSNANLLLAMLYEKLSVTQQERVLIVIKIGLSHLLETNLQLACEKLSLLTIIAENASAETLEKLMPKISSLILNYEDSDDEASDDEASDDDSDCSNDSDYDEQPSADSALNTQDAEVDLDSSIVLAQLSQVKLSFLELLRPIFSQCGAEEKAKFYPYLIDSFDEELTLPEGLILVELLSSDSSRLSTYKDSLIEEQCQKFDAKFKKYSCPFVAMADRLISRIESAFKNPVFYAASMQAPGVGMHANAAQKKSGFSSNVLSLFTGGPKK